MSHGHAAALADHWVPDRLIVLCVSVVLVQLVKASWAIRSVRRPGILLSVALVVWNGGDLMNALLIISASTTNP